MSAVKKGNLSGIIETTSINEKDIEEKEDGLPYKTSFDEAYRLATAKVRLLELKVKRKKSFQR